MWYKLRQIVFFLRITVEGFMPKFIPKPKYVKNFLPEMLF
jgi:hypothetical protein